ncbi:NAD(P)H-quinone oxidoreductase, partial [Pseudomonas syringae pv. tagetis]
PYILVFKYSRNASTTEMARQIARRIQMGPMKARLPTDPAVSSDCEATAPQFPENAPLYAGVDALIICAGLALRSPPRFAKLRG